MMAATKVKTRNSGEHEVTHQFSTVGKYIAESGSNQYIPEGFVKFSKADGYVLLRIDDIVSVESVKDSASDEV